MANRAHLFTDADNTLWDTDAVFAAAQLEMLREIERRTGHNAPADADRGLAFLRTVDQRIAAVHSDHLRYPPGLLAQGLALVLAGKDIAEVVERVTGPDAKISGEFEQVQAQFLESLKRITPLRDGVRVGLQAISAAHVPITIVTEERPERCRWLLAEHGLESLITEVISVRKSVEVYLGLKRKARCERCFMVGDQLDRDVQSATAAGFLAFYFPGGFEPYWVTGIDTSSTRRIARFDEIVAEVVGS
ncbi:putative hydrolase of the HAD superfamily [Bradyrhizobium sp. CIR48]|uniref:HAD family hydrolase n=1 Tax=Bradyrhizobium sp. CIR48 TaxID=2663840 RepID=UPI0016068D32|nr:HAD family hydrolase [Bradyrhizobium sp. CIR48]MBB4423888.1 putative hydrolase of the HAD superfamily [Bradyrhizobium sp. CIR48]